MTTRDPEDNVTYQNVGTVSGGLLTDIKAEQRSHAQRGAQILAAALIAEGVDTLFGYPGGANLEILDVLPEFGIRCIRVEHEQGAACTSSDHLGPFNPFSKRHFSAGSFSSLAC